MEKNAKQSSAGDATGGGQRVAEAGKSDLVIHDGEENVELVDSEWADFERALRYYNHSISLGRRLFFFLDFRIFKFTANRLNSILC